MVGRGLGGVRVGGGWTDGSKGKVGETLLEIQKKLWKIELTSAGSCIHVVLEMRARRAARQTFF